jgi:hypothetical protein
MLLKKLAVAACLTLGLGTYSLMGFTCSDAANYCKHFGWGNVVSGSCYQSGAKACFVCEGYMGEICQE